MLSEWELTLQGSHYVLKCNADLGIMTCWVQNDGLLKDKYTVKFY